MLWNERRNKKLWNFRGMHYVNAVDINSKMCERNVKEQ